MKEDKWFFVFAGLSLLIFLSNHEIYSGISRGLLQVGGVVSSLVRTTGEKIDQTILLFRSKKNLIQRNSRMASRLYLERTKNALLEARIRKYEKVKKFLKEAEEINLTLAEIVAYDTLPIPSRITVKLPPDSKVRANDTVIDPASQSLIGRIEKRSESFARIELINSPGFRIGVETRSGSHGIWVGKGTGARVIFVPIEKPMRQGEILFTSPISTLFPEGLKVGIITSKGKLKSFTLSYEAKPLFNPLSIDYVGIISSQHLRKKPRENATGKIPEKSTPLRVK